MSILATEVKDLEQHILKVIEAALADATKFLSTPAGQALLGTLKSALLAEVIPIVEYRVRTILGADPATGGSSSATSTSS